MDPVERSSALTLYSFDSSLPPVERPSIMALGADSDIGGLSSSKATHIPTAAFYPDDDVPEQPIASSLQLGFTSSPPSTSHSSSIQRAESTSGPHMSHVALHGNMSLRLPPKSMGRIRTGYVGMRNHFRPTMLGGQDSWDVRAHTHFRIVCAYRGWEGWRKRWYCNVQTDGPIQLVPPHLQHVLFLIKDYRTDLWQLRLDLPPSPASTPSTAALDPMSGPPPRWTTLHIPLSGFVLTNCGATSKTQFSLMSEAVRSVGFSLLGGGRDNEGLPVGGPGRHQAASDVLRADSNTLLSDEKRTDAQPGEMPPTGKEGITVTPWSEGYYELCVKSVEAVNYNPMLDDRPSEWDIWEGQQAQQVAVVA